MPLKSKKQKAENLGKKGESFALAFLMLKFYFLLVKNYKTPMGEVDLIIKRGKTIVFVEVKTRAKKTDMEVALLSVNKRRIKKAANHFIAKNPQWANKDLRFDVIFLAPNSLPHHIIGAF